MNVSINETLRAAILDNKFSNYNLPEQEIVDFLTIGEISSEEIQSKVVTIVRGIMGHHQKKNLQHLIAELARIECGTTEIPGMGRDHVVHAVLSFTLGAYINEWLFTDINFTVDVFQWKIAGLFHDIGYPIEIAGKIFRDYWKTINKTKIQATYENPFFTLSLEEIDNLYNGKNSFDLITQRLKLWDIHIDARKVFEKCSSMTKINHGIISALSILSIVDCLYQKNNPTRLNDVDNGWAERNFDEDIVSACSAIFIHNLEIEDFRGYQVDIKKSPIAYLLILADCLQDWDRAGCNNNMYAIDYKDGILDYKAPLDRAEKIQKEVRAKLFDIDRFVEFNLL